MSKNEVAGPNRFVAPQAFFRLVPLGEGRKIYEAFDGSMAKVLAAGGHGLPAASGFSIDFHSGWVDAQLDCFVTAGSDEDLRDFVMDRIVGDLLVCVVNDAGDTGLAVVGSIRLVDRKMDFATWCSNEPISETLRLHGLDYLPWKTFKAI